MGLLTSQPEPGRSESSLGLAPSRATSSHDTVGAAVIRRMAHGTDW